MLVRRHHEFTLIFNSECDAVAPKSGELSNIWQYFNSTFGTYSEYFTERVQMTFLLTLSDLTTENVQCLKIKISNRYDKMNIKVKSCSLTCFMQVVEVMKC